MFRIPDWIKVLNGSHTIRIEVVKPDTTFARRVFTFKKTEDTIQFSLLTPQIPSDNRTPVSVKKVLINGVLSGANVLVEACNNALDDSPVWEDFTDVYLTGQRRQFTNTTKTAENWGVNARFTITREAVPVEEPIFVHDARVEWTSDN